MAEPANAEDIREGLAYVGECASGAEVHPGPQARAVLSSVSLPVSPYPAASGSSPMPNPSNTIMTALLSIYQDVEKVRPGLFQPRLGRMGFVQVSQIARLFQSRNLAIHPWIAKYAVFQQPAILIRAYTLYPLGVIILSSSLNVEELPIMIMVSMSILP